MRVNNNSDKTIGEPALVRHSNVQLAVLKKKIISLTGVRTVMDLSVLALKIVFTDIKLAQRKQNRWYRAAFPLDVCRHSRRALLL